jgi:hypothetical protein
VALTSYEEKIWQELEGYFARPDSGPMARFAQAVFKPVELIADRVVPDSALELLGDAIERGLKWVGEIADRSVDVDALLSRFDELGVAATGPEVLRDADFRIMDEVAQGAASSDSIAALLEGAGCGLGGVALIAADIPLLLGISFRVVRRVSLCYGFDPSDPAEKAIAFKVFELAIGGTRERYDRLLELDALYDELDGLDPKERAEKAAVLGALLISREFVKKLAALLLSRKLAQAIPIIGSVVGGGFNYAFVDDVGLVTRQVMRRRVLSRRRAETGVRLLKATVDGAEGDAG